MEYISPFKTTASFPGFPTLKAGSGMLITPWAHPVLALKSNYLDCWPICYMSFPFTMCSPRDGDTVIDTIDTNSSNCSDDTPPN